MATTGRVTNVTEHIAGSELVANVSAAASSIEVEDVEEFDLDGGQFTIGSETHIYTANEDTGILTLVGSTLASGYSEGGEVHLYPEVRERWCRIMEPDAEEELEARVPHSLYALLPIGARTDDGTAEIVEADYIGTDLVVTDVIGKEPVNDTLTLRGGITAAEDIGSIRWVEDDLTPHITAQGLFDLDDEQYSLTLTAGNDSSATLVIRGVNTGSSGIAEVGIGVGGSPDFLLLNENGESDFALANVFGSGEWQDWTPTLSGWSANPAGGIYRYLHIGKTVVVSILQPNNGTSNATTKSITAPVGAAAMTGMIWFGYCSAVDNGVSLTTPSRVQVPESGTTIFFDKDWSASGGWTASGNHRIGGCTVIYEASTTP